MRERWHYGWAVVAALSITETTSWGVLYYGFAVFLTPIEASLGWSRVQMSGAFSLCLVVQGLAAMAVGRWLDGHSPRLLMTLGSVAATILTVLWSRVTSLSALYVVWAAIGAVMATVLYEPAFIVVTKWFRADRRAALTAITLVAALASTIFLPLENKLIEAYGWRRALLVLALILGLVTIPLHGLVLRPAPALVDRKVSGPDQGVRGEDDIADHSTKEALASPTFWLLTAAYVLNAFVTSALALHQVAYLIERGYGAAFAAGATGLLGAMQLPGRLLFAPLLRVLPRWVVTALVFGVVLAGLVVLAATDSTAMVWVFVVIYGIGRGMSTLLRATLVGELFGAANYGSISGILTFFTTAALAMGPLAAGLLYRGLGGYDDVLWLFVLVSALATVCAVLVERWPLPRRLA